MTTPQLLSAYEHCNRLGVWTRDWRRWKLEPYEMLQKAIRAGLLSDRKDFNIAAGEECIALGAEPGLESKQHNLYDEVIHIAALSDVICAAVRKDSEGPWGVPEPVSVGDGLEWVPGCFLSPDGTTLRRVVTVSNWSDDRHYSLCRAWESLGNVCILGLPMQMAICVLGAHKDGKYYGPLSKGYRHPVNRKLRFRKRNDVATGFKSTWAQIFREDYDEISTHDWLQAMHEDGVLSDNCFSVTIPVPEREARKQIVELAIRKLEIIESTEKLPDRNLSTCDFPTPCRFRSNCHSNNLPSWKYGFVPVDQVQR